EVNADDLEEKEKRILTFKKKVKKPKAAPPVSVEEETPVFLEVKGPDGSPVIVQVLDVKPELTEEDQTKPRLSKKKVKKTRAGPKESPTTHFVEALSPDGAPVIVEVNESDLNVEEKLILVKKFRKLVPTTAPYVVEESQPQDKSSFKVSKKPKGKSDKVDETPLEFTEIVGPDGRSTLVTVEEIFVVDDISSDGTHILVEIAVLEDVPKEKLNKVRKVKKLTTKPSISESELSSISPEDILDEIPEVVYREIIGPEGIPILVEGAPRIVTKLKPKSRISSEAIPSVLEVTDINSLPVNVDVVGLKSTLTEEDFRKPRLKKKKYKKTRFGAPKESPTTHFVEAIGPDGTPVIVEINEGDLSEQEKIIVGIKKGKPDKDSQLSKKRLPKKEAEVTEVIGPDGAPVVMEVKEAFVVEEVGPDGSTILVEVPDIQKLPADQKRKVKKVKKLSKPTGISALDLTSLLSEEVLEVSSEDVFTEAIGPNGEPLLVKGQPRTVKKIALSMPSETSSVTQAIVDEDQKKETKPVARKSRKPKDVSEIDFEEEEDLEEVSESGEGTSEEEDVIPGGLRGTSKRRPKGRKRPREVHYTEIVGPDGTPKLVEVKDTLALEVEGPKGTVLKEVKEKELTEEEKKKTKKVKKIGRTPKEITEADLPSISSQEIIKDSPEIVYTVATGPDGTPVLVRGKEMTVKTIKRPEAPAIPEKTAEEVIQKLPFAKQPETVYAELIAPDGTLFLVEVVEVPVVKGKGPDGSPVLVEVKQPLEDLPEKERKKIKTIKKLRKRPEESPQIQEADLISLPYEEIIEEAPEVVYTEATGPSGSPMLVKVTLTRPAGIPYSEKRRILKRIPKDVPEDTEMPFKKSQKPEFITAIGPDGALVIVEVKPCDLTTEEQEKISTMKKSKRKKPSDKSVEIVEIPLEEVTEKQYIEIPGPDGAPVVVEMLDVQDELPEEVNVTTRVVKKTKPRLPTADSPKELQTPSFEVTVDIPIQTREITGPDGKPSVVVVQEVFVVKAVGPDGRTTVTEVTEKDIQDFTEEERKRITKVKKIKRKPDHVPDDDISSMPGEVIEETPETVYIEEIGPDGKSLLVQAAPRIVKTLKRKPTKVPEVPMEEQDAPVFLDVVGPDGTPLTLQVLNVKPELSEEDTLKPRLLKKRVKKTRFGVRREAPDKSGTKESPTTHFVEAVGPDGVEVIVEVNENDLEDVEKNILTVKRKIQKPTVVSSPSEEEDSQFLEVMGPNGSPITLQVLQTKSELSEEDRTKPRFSKKKDIKARAGSKESPTTHFIEAVGPDGSPVIVEVNENELTDIEKTTLKLKTKKSDVPSKPRAAKKEATVEFIEARGPDSQPTIVEVQEALVVEATGPDGKPLLVEITELEEEKLPQEEKSKVKKVKKIPRKPSVSEAALKSILPEDIIKEVPEIVYTEVIGPDGKPVLIEGQPRFVKKTSLTPNETEDLAPLFLEVISQDGVPVKVQVVDVKSKLSEGDYGKPRLLKKQVKKTRFGVPKQAPNKEGTKESPTTHFVEAIGPDGIPIIVEVNADDLPEDEKRILTFKKRVKKPKPVSDQEGKKKQRGLPKDARKEVPAEVTEIIGPDGKPTLVEVFDTAVVEFVGPDGKPIFVEITEQQEQKMNEEEKRKVKRIKKIRKKPHEIAEAELPSISPDEVLEEVPEVVFTEEVGPDGTPVLVEGQSRVVKKIKRKPRRASEVLSEEEEGPVFLEVPGPDGSPIKVQVLEVKPELSVEDLSKPMLSKKKVKKTITGRKESITTHFVDALGPDGTPFIVEVNESDLKEEEKRILTIKKKVRKPKVPVEQEADDKRVRRPKEVPIEFTEVTGPDGQPTIVEVQETLVIEEMGPEGIPVLVEITELEEERLPEDKRRRVKKVRKITRKPSVSEEILKSLPADLIVEEIPEEVYSEAIGPDGKPVLVQGPRRLVKKTKPISVSVPEVLPDEEEALVFLEVTGPDGTPVTVQVLSAKPELTEEDLDKPRLSKKKVKKTRAGPKEAPTTHFIEALGPDGSPIIVEVNAKELTEEEKVILTVKKKVQKPRGPTIPKSLEKDLPVEFTSITGPDGITTFLEVQETKAVEDVGSDGNVVLVEITDVEEDELDDEKKTKVKKVRKIPRKPSVSGLALKSITADDVVEEFSTEVYTEMITPDGKPVLLQATPSLVKKTSLTPKEVKEQASIFLEVIDSDGNPVLVEVVDVKPELSEGDFGKPRMLKKQVKKTRFGVRKEAPDKTGTKESPTTHFVEALSPDGIPVIVEVNADDLAEDEKQILTFKKKVRKPKVSPQIEEQPIQKKPKRRPKVTPEAAPVEVTEITGPDGTPSIVEVLETFVIESIGPDGSKTLVEVQQNQEDLTEEQKRTIKKVKKIGKKPLQPIEGDISSIPSEDVLEEISEIVFVEETGPDGSPVLVRGVPRAVKKLRRKPIDAAELASEEEGVITVFWTDIIGPDGTPVTLQVLNVKPELSDADLNKPRLSRKKVKKTRAGPKVSPTTHFAEAVGPDGNPVIVEINESELTEEEKCILLPKTKERKPKQITKQIPERDVIEVMGPEGRPIIIDFEVVLEVIETEKRKQADKKKVRKPKEAPKELPTGTVTIEELPDEIEIQSLDGTPVVVKAKDLIPKLEEMTEKRTKKPKKQIKSSEDQEEDELPETLYIAATGPDGSPIVVEVKPKDLTSDERQSVKRLKRKKSQVEEEAVEGELVEAIGPDGIPVLVQVKGAKSKLTEEDLQKPRLTKKKGKKTPWGTPKATPTTHFVEAVGPDGSSVIVEVNETELTEEEKVTLKIKKPKRREEEAPVTEYIEVIGPDGIPSLVEITEILDDLSEEDERKRRVVKKGKRVPTSEVPRPETEVTIEELLDEGHPEDEYVEKKLKRRLKGTPKAREDDVSEDITLKGSPTEFQPELLGLRGDDRELIKKRRRIVVKRKRAKDNITDEEEEVLEILPEDILPEDHVLQVIDVTSEASQDRTLPRNKKLLVKRSKPTDAGAPVEELWEVYPEDVLPNDEVLAVKEAIQKPKTTFIEAIGPDGTPFLIEVNDTELTTEEKEKIQRLKRSKAKMPSERYPPEFIEVMGPDGNPMIVHVQGSKPKLTEEDMHKPRLTKKLKVKKSRFGTPKEAPTTHFVEALNPDGNPVIVEVNEAELTEDEKVTFKIKMPDVKASIPEDEVVQADFIVVVGPDGSSMVVEMKEVVEDLPEQEKQRRTILRKRKPKRSETTSGDQTIPSEVDSATEVLEEAVPEGVSLEGGKVKTKIAKPAPKEITEIVGPDGQPTLVKVEEVFVIEDVLPDGKSVLRPVQNLEDLTPNERKRVKKVKKLLKPTKPSEESDSLESSEVLEETPETVYVEHVGPDGKPVLVKESKRIIKKIKPSTIPSEEEDVPVFLEVIGPDGTPVTLEVLDVKPELSEEDKLKPRMLKKKEKKTRFGVRKEAADKTGTKESPTTHFVEALGPDGIPVIVEVNADDLADKEKGILTFKRKTRKPKKAPEILPEESPVFLEVTGPDGSPITVRVLDVKPELSEEDLTKPRISKKKVKKTPAGPKDSPTTHFVEALGPDGYPLIVEVNENDLRDEEKAILTVKKRVTKPVVPSAPKPTIREAPVEFTDTVGPDGQPFIAEVQNVVAVEAVGPDGQIVLVEITELEEEKLPEQEKAKVKKIKKIPRKPSVSEVGMKSILPEDIVEEIPETVYVEVVGPNGNLLLVEGQPRLVKKTSLTPTEVEEQVPIFLEVVGPDGALVKVQVLDVRPDLLEEDYGKPRLLKKKVKKTRYGVPKQAPNKEGTMESPTTHIVEALGPDGTPVIVEVHAEDLAEDEKRILTFKKKIRKPKILPETEIPEVQKKPRRRTKATPKEAPREFTEIIGPDGQPSLVEVQETFVIEDVSSDGKPTLVEITPQQNEDLPDEERRKVKKVKKIRKIPQTVSDTELPSISPDEVLEEVPEVLFTEEVGPDGTPFLVEAGPRIVKKIKTKPRRSSDVPSEDEEANQFLEVSGPDGSPINVEVLEIKSELSEEDFAKPRLSKKKSKKTRTGSKVSPTTHYIDALSPDGTSVIVEINESDLNEDEKRILTIPARVGKTKTTEEQVAEKPKRRPTTTPKVEFTEVTGPDGEPTVVEVQETLAMEDVSPDGKPILVEITEIEEEDLPEQGKSKVKKVRKIPRKSSVSQAALKAIPSEDITETVPDIVYTVAFGPNGKMVLVEGQPMLVKRTTLGPKEVENLGPIFLEVIGPDGTPLTLEVLDVKQELSEGDYGKPRLLKKQVKKTRFGIRKEAPDKKGTLESPTTHFVEALGPDGNPVIVEVNSDDLAEDEKRILTFKKKVKKPEDNTKTENLELKKKPKRRPKDSPQEVSVEFIQVTGPDGKTTLVEVQDTLVLDDVGLDGKPVLVEITELEEERLPEDKRRRVKKVKKITRKPSVSEEVLKTLPDELIVEEIPEEVYSEAIGPDGKPVLVQGPRRIVKKTKPISVSVPEDLPDEEEAPVFLEVTGPDGTPVTVQVLFAKPELTEKDLDKPRLSKKKVKKTRAGPKEAPTTHFIEALGPDGSPVIVEVNAKELTEEEKNVLAFVTKARMQPTYFITAIGPDGSPLIIEARDSDLTVEEKAAVQIAKRTKKKPKRGSEISDVPSVEVSEDVPETQFLEISGPDGSPAIVEIVDVQYQISEEDKKSKPIINKRKPSRQDIPEGMIEGVPLKQDLTEGPEKPFGVNLKAVHVTTEGKKVKKVTKKTPEGDKVVFEDFTQLELKELEDLERPELEKFEKIDWGEKETVAKRTKKP
ncbi:unnamed protein product, partial [Allacma fusca]